MLRNINKILLVLLILIIFGLAAILFVNHKKSTPIGTPITISQISSQISSKLPNLSELKNVNLPQNLVGPQATGQAASLDPAKIIALTNQYRADNSLPALKENDELTAAADSKVTDMFAKQYFEHVAPDGTTPAQRVLSFGYNYKVTGENLALGDFKDEKDLVDAWMASPGHRANILNKYYTEIGVATGLNTYQGRQTWLSSQEFGEPAPNCSQPDQTLNSTIDTKKAAYQSLSDQESSLSSDAQSLANQANDDITRGNQIYTSTGSKKQAQVYWTKAQDLQAQSNDKLAQAKTLDSQLKSQYSDISSLVSKYNAEINTYNSCIGS